MANYAQPYYISPTASLQPPGSYVFWAIVSNQSPVLHLLTSYVYPEVELNPGDQVTFIMAYDVPTGPLLAFVDFGPAFPVYTNGQSGVTSGQMIQGVWYSFEFNGNSWTLLNPSAANTGVVPGPIVAPPQPLPDVQPPVNATFLSGGYYLPAGGSCYATFNNAGFVNLNVALDSVAQNYGIYEVTLAGGSASGSVTYVCNDGPSGTVLPSGGVTQRFSVSVLTLTINDLPIYPVTAAFSTLGTLVFPTLETGVVVVRRLL